MPGTVSRIAHTKMNVGNAVMPAVKAKLSATSLKAGLKSGGEGSASASATPAPPIAPAAPTVNLVVATPCFGGQVSVHYAIFFFKLQKIIRSYSAFNLKVLFKDSDALITRARASLVAQFLDDPAATHLLFIDADIGF